VSIPPGFVQKKKNQLEKRESRDCEVRSLGEGKGPQRKEEGGDMLTQLVGRGGTWEGFVLTLRGDTHLICEKREVKLSKKEDKGWEQSLLWLFTGKINSGWGGN